MILIVKIREISVIGLFTFLILGFVGCTDTQTKIESIEWGTTQNKPIYLYTLTNANGMEVKVTNFGAIVTSVLVPDKNQHFDDIVLGFDNLEQYVGDQPCFGATIGRYANRIKNAQFVVNDSIYHLEKNDGNNHSHGAREFDKAVWKPTVIKHNTGEAIRLTYVSKDGTMGMPGNLDVEVIYSLSNENALRIDYRATTDKPTHVNLTHHSYFNLAGTDQLIYDHKIKIDASTYNEIDNEIVPTGGLGSVIGTDWDLTKMTRIGDNIHKLNYYGYHFCYAFDKELGVSKKVIEVTEPTTGRTLSVTTSQPGVQFYTSNALSDKIIGKYGHKYQRHSAFCLETQYFPNSPNLPNFPSTLLVPGDEYKEHVIYDFGVE